MVETKPAPVGSAGDGDDAAGTTSAVDVDTSGVALVRAVLGTGRRSPPLQLVPGQMIADSYQIVRTLGAGGMGVVYLARDVRLNRDVAIKLHVADTSGPGVARLIREATAIAQLVHPNVVTVYQIETYQGHPFVAMEYLDGGTARTWRARSPRSWREIVALYLAAGRGLAAAHAAGLVHRDFKPDNVLVGADGRVRVADFGLVQGAGSTSAEHPDKPDGDPPLAVTRTRPGTVMGTPAYMAPEQHRGDPVDAAADQFSFAVALWEALTGARPFVGGSGAELQAAQARPLAPPVMPMPRHLEVALRRALAHDATARWPALPPLLAVLARDPQRTRRRLLGATLIAVTLIGAGVVVASWREAGGAKAEPPCAAADGLATAARLRANVPARADDRALPKLDAWMARWRTARVTACEDTHVRREQPVAVLELRELCLDRARAGLEATLGELASATDRDALVDGLPGLAECADRDQLATTAPLPPDPRARAEIAAVSAIIAQVEVTRAAGRLPEALAAITAVIPRADATGRASLAAEARLMLGVMHVATGQLDGVVAEFEEAAKLAAEGRDDRIAARAWLWVLDALVARLEQPAEAARMVPVAEAAVLRAGNTERLRADLLGTLGDLDLARGDYRAARDRYRESIALHERAFGENAELARKLNRLASISSRLDDLDGARAHLRRAADVLERNYGPRYRHLAVIWTTLGGVELRAGNPGAARVLLERALTLKEATSGADSVVLVPTLTDLALVLIDLRDLDLAARHARRAIAIARRVLGPDHAKVVHAARAIAKVQIAQEDWRGAAQTLTEALAIQRRIGALPPADSLELDLAGVAIHERRYPEARAAVARARGIARVAGEDSYMMAKVHEMTGRIELASGHRSAALVELERALAILTARYPADHPEVVILRSLIDATP